MDIRHMRTLRKFLGQVTLGNLPKNFVSEEAKHLHDIYVECDRAIRLVDEGEAPVFLKPQAD